MRGSGKTWSFCPRSTAHGIFSSTPKSAWRPPLTQQLSLQTFVQDSYANEPAPGFKDNDVKLVSALAYKF